MKKILISLAIIGIVAGITLGVTGAWWSDSAKSENASFKSGTLNLQLANHWRNIELTDDPVQETWDQSNMEPGGTPLDSSLYMKNVGSIDANHMGFAVTGLSGSGFSGNLNMAQYMRITKLDYSILGGDGNPVSTKNLLTGGAGADLSSYVAPTHCDVTVDPGVADRDTIHEGIAKAGTGDVVCVKPGNYNSTTWSESFPITVNQSITLVSLEGPASTTITVTNGSNAIDINANDVTIKGFTINGGVQGINTGGHSGITIKDNKIENYNGNGAEGILVDGGTVSITNNVIQASATANPTYSIDSIYTKGGAQVTVDHNTLKDNRYDLNAYKPNILDWSTSAGIAVHGGSAVTATNNLFDNNDFGIQVKSETGGGQETVTAHYNNFLNTNAVDFFYEKKSGSSVTPFNATDNWWGTDNKSEISAKIKAGDSTGLIDADSYVNYTPYANGPFIGYVDGVDHNHNGYADLYDFYARRTQAGIKDSVVPGLNHNQWGKLDMAVQLDATTPNAYQGKSLGMEMTANMYQH